MHKYMRVLSIVNRYKKVKLLFVKQHFYFQMQSSFLAFKYSGLRPFLQKSIIRCIKFISNDLIHGI